MGSAVAHGSGAVEWAALGRGAVEWVAVGGHSSGGSVAILAAGGVDGCPVCAAVVGAAAAAAADEVVVVEGVPLRLPLVELLQPAEEPVVRLRVRLILLQVVLVQADVA